MNGRSHEAVVHRPHVLGFEKKVADRSPSACRPYGLQDEIGRHPDPDEDVVEMRGGNEKSSARSGSFHG